MESAALLCFQSFGEFLRWNSHWHAIVLEGGFDKDGNFIHSRGGRYAEAAAPETSDRRRPAHSATLHQMTECFRRRVIKFFLDSGLIKQMGWCDISTPSQGR